MNHKKILHFSYIFILLYFTASVIFYLKLKDYKKYYLNIDNLLGQSLENISKNFLNKDYFTEKDTGLLDEPSIFNTNNFNCLTFVEMVLAFHISKNFNNLHDNLKKIKYKDGNVDFLDRNHFITTDWIPNNSWLLKDITKEITDNYKTKTVKIDKKSWIIKNYKEYYDYLKKNKQLQKLNDFKIIEKNIDYIPLQYVLYDEDFIKKLPEESVIFIIKDLKNMKDKIGTDLDVTHTGFLFKKKNIFYKYFKELDEYKLIFRHASSAKNEIVDVNFKKYLENSRNIQGIVVITLNEKYE